VNYLAFSLFLAAFALWFWLHLAAALRAVNRLKVSDSPEIDLGFVRTGDFHAREVREGNVAPARQADAFATFPKQRVQGTVLSRGDCLLRCGTRVGAIVSTGELALKNDVVVEQFADSRGNLTMGKRCSVRGRATSAESIHVGEESRARSFEGNQVMTDTADAKAPAPPVEDRVTVPLGGETVSDAGVDSRRMRRMAEDTWLYRGDLTPAKPLLVRSRLVVLGRLELPAGSILEADVTATGDVRLGAGSSCRSIFSDSDIRMGEGCRFAGVLYAGGELRLGNGVLGEGDARVAYGRARVRLHKGVVVRGKIASGGEVVCEPGNSL